MADLVGGFVHLVGGEFIETYLSPATRAGCKEHDDVGCLCDVDVTKTFGIVWDNCPGELLNVETTSDLVVAAANIWLNLDVLGVDRDTEYRPCEAFLSDPGLREALPLVKQGQAHRQVRRKFPALDVSLYRLMRKLCGFGRRRPGGQVGRNRTLPYGRIFALHEAGMTGTEIHRLFQSEGLPGSRSRIQSVIRERRNRLMLEQSATLDSDAESA